MISASSDDLPVGGMDAARMENGGTESPGVMEEKKIHFENCWPNIESMMGQVCFETRS